MSETDALIAVIAVSDAGVESKSAISALESGDVSSIVKEIVEDSKVSHIISEATKPEEKPEEKPESKPTSGSGTSSYSGGSGGDGSGGSGGSPSLSATANKVSFGTKEVTIKDNKFNLYSYEDENITNFFNIDLSEAYTISSTSSDLDSIDDLNITITVSEEGVDKSATLKVINAKVYINDKKITKTEFNSNTTIAVSPHNLKKLQKKLEVDSDGTVDAKVASTLTNTDLKFDIQKAVLVNLTGSKKDKIRGALDVLNEYFQTAEKSYTVKIKVESKNVTLSGSNSITGKVSVVKNVAPELNITKSTIDFSNNTAGSSFSEVIGSGSDEYNDSLICSVKPTEYNCSISNEGKITLEGTVPSKDTNVTIQLSDDKNLSVSKDISLTAPIDLAPIIERLKGYYGDKGVALSVLKNKESNNTKESAVTITNFSDSTVIVAFEYTGVDTSAGGTMYLHETNTSDDAFLKLLYQGTYANKNVTIWYKKREWNTTISEGDFVFNK
jgi:hypothetical protein